MLRLFLESLSHSKEERKIRLHVLCKFVCMRVFVLGFIGIYQFVFSYETWELALLRQILQIDSWIFSFQRIFGMTSGVCIFWRLHFLYSLQFSP